MQRTFVLFQLGNYAYVAVTNMRFSTEKFLDRVSGNLNNPRCQIKFGINKHVSVDRQQEPV